MIEQPKAVIYCRVSTKEQVDEGNSLPTQERICREYAEKHHHEVVQVFIEQGESAKTKDRTQLQLLFNFCSIKKNGVKAVIIYKLDRLSRNTDDYSYIRLLLKRFGVEIKSTSEYFENTPAGRFMENIIANVAQFDNDVRAERCTTGMKEAMREGRYVWAAPIGYANVRVNGKATITPSNQASVVKTAFLQVAQNLRHVEEVRKDMVELGLVNKKGNPYSRSHFYDMLKNPVYVGWITKFGERHRGTFDSIINQDLFDQVQWVLSKRKRKGIVYNKENPDFPLRRFLYHPSGMKLTGGWSTGRSKKYPYYCFNNTGRKSFAKEKLETEFVHFLNQYRLSRNYFERLKNVLLDALAKYLKGKTQQNEDICKSIEELKLRANNLIKKNSEGIISDSFLKEQMGEVEQTLADYRKKLLNEPSKTINYMKVLKKCLDFLDNPGYVWERASFANKLNLQWFNFPEGIIFNGEQFRTTKIARIFNVKSDFYMVKSPKVNLSDKTLNHPEVGNYEIKLKEPLEINSYLDSIIDDLTQYHEMMSNKSPKVAKEQTIIELYGS